MFPNLRSWARRIVPSRPAGPRGGPAARLGPGASPLEARCAPSGTVSGLPPQAVPTAADSAQHRESGVPTGKPGALRDGVVLLFSSFPGVREEAPPPSTVVQGLFVPLHIGDYMDEDLPAG